MRQTVSLIAVTLLLMTPLVSSAESCALEGLININTAGTESLETLTGIGPAKATSIIEYRNTNGLFTQIADIVNVSGIGAVTYENIKSCITVGNSAPQNGTDDTDTSKAEEEKQKSSTNSVSSGSTASNDNQETISLTVPLSKLSINIDAPNTVHVNQPLTVTAEPKGITEGLRASVQYVWNMGDTYTKTGAEVKHAYAFPGEYVIAVDGSYARHHATGRHEITVLPVTFTISYTEAGNIQIKNDAQNETDISGYTLQGTSQFVFPENSILLPQATIIVPASRITSSGIPVALFDQQNKLVAQSNQKVHSERAISTQNTRTQAVLGESITKEIESESDDGFSFQSDEEISDSSDIVLAEQTEEIETKGASTERNESIPYKAGPYLGLIAIVAIGIGALYVGGYRKSNAEKDV
ncbi:MAG: helix-hairpin-helix domain-containing protein [Candidatus Paceibacterota bacterium]